MRKWFLWGSLALNLAFIAAAVAAVVVRQERLNRFLAIEIAHETTFFREYPIMPGDIVMLGDSITDEGHWREMFPGLPIRNHGVTGDTTAGVLARLDLVAAGAPAAVFVKIGVNDARFGIPLRDSARHYRDIVRRLQAGAPDADLYLQSILPHEARRRREIEAFNAEIRAIADEFGVEYIDLYDSFLDTDGSLRDEFSSDENHLNGAGYRLWASLLAPHLAAYETGDVAR